MANAEKILARMRNNPRDWRIEDLKVLAARFGIAYWQHGSSHAGFRLPSGRKIVVPVAKPIKEVYVKQFLALLVDSE
jgi:hypothetical protein